jgi:predicted porin
MGRPFLSQGWREFLFEVLTSSLLREEKMLLITKSAALNTAILLGFGSYLSAAQAQSNVQIYGIIDAGVEYVNNIAVAGAERSRTALGSSHLIGSRWGLRGTEDLGGGMRAEFTVESGFAPDTGQMLQNGRLFGRQAYVGLSNQWGRLLLGRQNSALYDLAINYDPLLYATFSLQGVDPAGFVSRADNTAKALFKAGPLSASAFYSLGRDALAGTPPGSQSEVPGASKVGRQLGGSIDYAAGPLSLGLAYDQQHGGTIPTASDADKRLLLATRYKMGNTIWIAGYQRRENDIPVVDQDTNLYWLGALFELQPTLKLNVGLYHTRVEESAARSNRIAASVIQDLSKRTSVYVNLGYVDNKGPSTLGLLTDTPTLPGAKQAGLVVGVVHRF